MYTHRLRTAGLVAVAVLCWCLQAAAAITITGPSEIPVGSYAFLKVTGVSLDEMRKAEVKVVPAGPEIQVFVDLYGNPVLFFPGHKQGAYTISVGRNAWSQIVDDSYQVVKTAPIAEADELLRTAYLTSSAALTAAYRPDSGSCKIVVGDDDPPPPPDGKKQVAFIHESADLDNLPAAQRTLLNSLTLRAEIDKAGHKFLGLWDDDATPPARLQPWYDAIKNDPLPRIVVAPVEGGDIKDYPFPSTREELWKILGGK